MYWDEIRKFRFKLGRLAIRTQRIVFRKFAQEVSIPRTVKKETNRIPIRACNVWSCSASDAGGCLGTRSGCALSAQSSQTHLSLQDLPAARLFTHVLPNSSHFRHGTLLSHLTFSLEHSSQAWRFLPLSSELGISEEPRLSQRLKWSRRTSLCPRMLIELIPTFRGGGGDMYLRLKVFAQNIQLYGLSPESGAPCVSPEPKSASRGDYTRCC
jgi:hypothetical protein